MTNEAGLDKGRGGGGGDMEGLHTEATGLVTDWVPDVGDGTKLGELDYEPLAETAQGANPVQ